MREGLIIGVAGAMQTGKQENKSTFEGAGFKFLDLNTLADHGRAHDGAIRFVYADLNLRDAITLDGKRTGAYYMALLADPSIHQRVMGVEVPYVLRRLMVHLRECDDTPLAISWGYLHLLLPELSHILRHIILTVTDAEVWYNRLRSRAAAMGLPQVNRYAVQQLLTASQMHPMIITQALTASDIPTVVADTSAEDWGAAEIRRILAGFTA